MDYIIEALRFFENIKPAMEGVVAAGTVIASTASVTISVVKKGATLLSYLIKPPEKNAGRKKKTSAGRLDITSPDVAIVVDISQPILERVGAYLKKKRIKADVLLVTNRLKYSDRPEFLDAKSERDWEAVVQDFADVMYEVRRAGKAARVHIFLAAPLPLTFAMGAVWGTVENAILYHWDGEAYSPVFKVNQALRASKR